ncbi:MAG: ATP-binding protein [Caldilineaceae bacterium]
MVALQARLEAIEARAGLQIDLRVEGENRLPIMIEDDLYKIAQEALNNVVKHAKAEVVSVHLRFTDDACWMTIQDDGVGFDPATAERRRFRVAQYRRTCRANCGRITIGKCASSRHKAASYRENQLDRSQAQSR